MNGLSYKQHNIMFVIQISKTKEQKNLNNSTVTTKQSKISSICEWMGFVLAPNESPLMRDSSMFPTQTLTDATSSKKHQVHLEISREQTFV